MIQKFVRHVWKSEKLEPDEVVIIKKVHLCYTQTIGPDLPHELQMQADDVTPCHSISPTDLIKSFWVAKLNQSLLTTEVSEMIGDITNYMSNRASLSRTGRGNPNDPWYLLCYHFLTWLSRDLSGAKCTKQTLDLANSYCQFIIKLRESEAFKTKDDDKKTMLDVLTSILGTLQERIIPIITKEIANAHVRQHIATLRISGESLLNYGFQFLYYVLRKTKKTPAPNITQLSSEILETRSGKLLATLLKTPFYCKIFELGAPSTTSTINPFLNSENQPCIPKELLEGLASCTEIAHYLGRNARGHEVHKSGFHQCFSLDRELLIDHIKMLALLVEFARAVLSCYDAYNAAGIGGDLLVYGKSQEIIIGLMNTIQKLCATLGTLHQETTKKADKLRGDINRKKLGTRQHSDKRWNLNYDKVFAINIKLTEAIEACSSQAESIKKEAGKIPIDKRIEIALAQTRHFTETASLLSNHIDSFLEQKPNHIMHRRETVGSSPRFLPAPRLDPSQAVRGTRAMSVAHSPNRSASDTFLISGSSTPSTPVMNRHRPENSSSQANLLSITAVDSTSDPIDLFELRCTPHSLSDQSIKFFLQLIEDRPELKKFFVCDQALSGNGAESLWTALSKLSTLKVIMIMRNPNLFSASYGRNGVQEPNNMDAVTKFSDMLTRQPQLWFLTIAECNLNLTSVSIISNRLRHLPELEILDLSNNPIGDDSLSILCEALTKTESLQDGEYEFCPNISELRLVNCNLTDKGGEVILTLLEKKPRITNVLIMRPEELDPKSQPPVSQYNRNQTSTPPTRRMTTSPSNDFSPAMIQRIAAKIDTNNQAVDQPDDILKKYLSPSSMN